MELVNQSRLENTDTHSMSKYVTTFEQSYLLSLSNNSKIVGTEIGILIILDYLKNVLNANEIYIYFLNF